MLGVRSQRGQQGIFAKETIGTLTRRLGLGGRLGGLNHLRQNANARVNGFDYLRTTFGLDPVSRVSDRRVRGAQPCGDVCFIQRCSQPRLDLSMSARREHDLKVKTSVFLMAQAYMFSKFLWLQYAAPKAS